MQTFQDRDQPLVVDPMAREKGRKKQFYYTLRDILLKTGLREQVRRVLGQDTVHRIYGYLVGQRAPVIYTRRAFIAEMYLNGQGIEIGALHRPLKVPKRVKVLYVDRMSLAELSQHYRELGSEPLKKADILDDGETLASIVEASQDFVIANHFIEHCQSPLRAIENMLRVLRPNGVLFLTVPDKRYSPDVNRPITPIEHILRDYHEGPEWSKRQHFEEWVRLWLYEQVQDEQAAQQRAAHLMETDYSIHYHVWDHTAFLQVLLTAKDKLPYAFEIEMYFKNDSESIVILRRMH